MATHYSFIKRGIKYQSSLFRAGTVTLIQLLVGVAVMGITPYAAAIPLQLTTHDFEVTHFSAKGHEPGFWADAGFDANFTFGSYGAGGLATSFAAHAYSTVSCPTYLPFCYGASAFTNYELGWSATLKLEGDPGVQADVSMGYDHSLLSLLVAKPGVFLAPGISATYSRVYSGVWHEPTSTLYGANSLLGKSKKSTGFVPYIETESHTEPYTPAIRLTVGDTLEISQSLDVETGVDLGILWGSGQAQAVMFFDVRYALSEIGTTPPDPLPPVLPDPPEVLPDPVPEPTTLALMCLGLAGIGYQWYRCKNAA